MSEHDDTLKSEAERLGLRHLSDAHLEQFAKARNSVENVLGKIPRDLHMYDEPAHTFRASQEA